jgi:hypothetical protein
MARDDDDAVSEEPMRRKDRDDDDQDRPRKKSSRDGEGDDGDEDRPRKKKARDNGEDRGGKEARPMPIRLVGAIIASMAWGGYVLHHNCGLSSSALIGIIHMEKRDRGRDFGFVFNPAFGLVDHKGFIYTVAAAEFFMMVLGAVLLAGGVLLLMRMGFGKYLAMGAPAAMALVELITFVICLAITSGAFLTTYNAGFAVNIIFSLGVGGCNAFMLLNKEVSKALN